VSEEEVTTFACAPVTTLAIGKVLWGSDGWDTFLSRRLPEDEATTESMRRFGQLEPVLVEEVPGGRYKTVDGFARVAGARSLGWQEIAARVVEGGSCQMGVFVKALVLNGPARYGRLSDQAAAAARAEALGFSREEVVRDIAPLVGLASAQRIVVEALRVAALGADIQAAYEDGRLSEEQLKALSMEEGELRQRLFNDVFLDGRLSVNETRQVVELLEELSVRDSVSKTATLRDAMRNLDGERGPGRARALLEVLRERRLPLLAEHREAFRKRAGTIGRIPGVQVGDPGVFESNALRLTLTFESNDALAQQLKGLERCAAEGDVAKLLSVLQGEGS